MASLPVNPEMADFCTDVLTTAGFNLVTMTTPVGGGRRDAVGVLTLIVGLDDDGAEIVVAHIQERAHRSGYQRADWR